MDFESYYVNQAGNGLPGFHGVKWQRGHGFFGRLLQMVLPVIKRALPVVGKQALSTGISLGKDILAGENVKSSFKNRLKEAGNNLLTEAENSLTQKGSGRRKRKMPFFQPGNTPNQYKKKKRRGRKKKSSKSKVKGLLKSIKRGGVKKKRKKRKSQKKKVADFLS